MDNDGNPLLFLINPFTPLNKGGFFMGFAVAFLHVKDYSITATNKDHQGFQAAFIDRNTLCFHAYNAVVVAQRNRHFI